MADPHRAAIVFHPRTTPQANMQRIQPLAELTLGMSPIGMPISEGHLVSTWACALAHIGVRIGVGPGEVSPDEAIQALKTALAEMRPMAEKDLADQAEFG